MKTRRRTPDAGGVKDASLQLSVAGEAGTATLQDWRPKPTHPEGVPEQTGGDD